LGDVFPFVSEHVARHAYGLKSGAIQEPVMGGVCSTPIAISRAALIAGRKLSTVQVLLRRTRQVLTTVAAVAFVATIVTFLSTWRPALSESGFLELRHGPKWLSALNVGPWHSIVETGLSKEDLKDNTDSPEVLRNLQNESGTYPWPGADPSGIRRWVDVVISNWMKEDVATLWSVRLDIHGAVEQLRGENAKLIPESKATEYAAEHNLLRPDLPLLDTWKYQWNQTAFGASCDAHEVSGRTAELAELYVGLASEDQTANWLRGLALTAATDDQVAFDRVIQLIATFKAMRLSWEKSYRSTMASETEPLSPARVAKVFSERPSRLEADALADLADAIVVRRIRAGQPALAEAERSALISGVGGCGNWVVPIIARLGPFGDPNAVYQWARARQAGDQGRNSLLVLAKYSLLDSSVIEWLLNVNGFDGDYFAKKSALTNSGEWLASVAQYQALPKLEIDELLAFCKTAIDRNDFDYAKKALKPLAWNTPHMQADQRHLLLELVNSLHEHLKITSADEVEIRGILQLGPSGDAQVRREGLLAELGPERQGKLPTITFTPEDVKNSRQQTQLMSGWRLNDLIAVSRVVVGMPKQSTLYRNPTISRFLQDAARDGIRAGMPLQRLKPVFVAISDLQKQFSSEDIGATGIAKNLRTSRDDYAQRELSTEVAITALSATEYNNRAAILGGLRRDWGHESEPEIKYALATIIIECYRREKLADADIQLLVGTPRPGSGLH
jgi:hypothetical protein